MVQDRVCQQQKKKVGLSVQEIVNCDSNNYFCQGGYTNRALNWGKKKGFVLDKCLPYSGEKGECADFEENECRYDNDVWRVIDYCIAYDVEDIKKEILKNGPVAAQMTVYTDFLTYKEGVYHRSEDSFKFNGAHVVKIVGW